MKDVKKSDSNPGPHDQWSNTLTTRLPTAAAESAYNLLYLCTTLLMYTVTSPNPKSATRGEMLIPNPKSAILR